MGNAQASPGQPSPAGPHHAFKFSLLPRLLPDLLRPPGLNLGAIQACRLERLQWSPCKKKQVGCKNLQRWRRGKKQQQANGLWSLETKGNAALLGFSGSASVASPTEVFPIACHLRAFLTADAGKMSRTCSPAELPSKSEIKIEVWMVIPPIFSHTHAVVNHETQTLFSLSIWCKSCL